MKRGELEGRLLTLVTLALVAFGLVMVYSATSGSAAIASGDPSAYLKRQAIYALLGVGLLIGASRFDYRRLRALAPGLVLGSLFLCLLVLVAGTQVNGAKRWLSLGPAAFQPSELAKLALAIWVAGHLARRRPPQSLRELARPIGLLAAIFCGLILLEPDLGTAIAIVVMLASVLLVSGAPLATLGAGSAIATALGVAAIWLEPYRRARLFTFLDPWRDPMGAGLQNVQAMISLGSGGLVGRGLGNGIEKIHYLPEAHTDMILAVIGEELGLIGVAAVIAAYAVFAYAGLRLALTCRDPFGKRLAAGITSLVCGQAVINLAAVLGLAPLTGIPLPFVSYGGSSLVVQLASVGILLNIAGGHAGAARAQVPDRSRRDGGARPAGARGRGRPQSPGRERDVRRVARSR
ncbi:MAG TPA: putative lipid II flippase FtsW [Gaiellaceae bacterium]